MQGLFAGCIFLLGVLASGFAEAATLSVSPVSFDIVAPRANAKLTLQNRGKEQVAVQVRVFRWVKKNGADHLIPTRDVVASPPMAKLKPGGKYTVRIVRVSETVVQSEESYRLLVDQLPKPAKRAGPHVSFLIRQSIPVFFTPEVSEKKPVLKWSARLKGGELVLTATNSGLRHTRLSQVDVRSFAVAERPAANGLAGYVLAGSAAKWVQPAPKGLAPGSRIIITAQDEHGPIEATAIIGAAE
jgi:fimbrial chaperone protein